MKFNGTTTSGTLYWYMTPGIVAETDLAGNLTSEYVFFGGERVARRDYTIVGSAGSHPIYSTTTSYYFSDHLKTASVITDAAGNIKAESDYYPWGGELQFTNNDSNHYKFTGKERDTETGLDYFGARYYSNGLGRWVSADWSPTPIPVPYADFGDPQTLNLYGYVRSLPTSRVDIDGHQQECATCPKTSPPPEPGPGEVDQAIKALEDRAANEAVEKTGSTLLDVLGDALGVIGIVLTNPQKTGGPEIDELHLEQENKSAPEPEPASGGARKGGKGGENSDTKQGREKHNEFFDKARAKGWDIEPRLIDPKTGKTVIPDTVTKTGHPVELKPKTKSGRAAGKKVLPKYERATKKKGRIVYYDK